MKPYKVLLFAISLLTANTAFTQFNTVSQDVPKYKVSERSASQPTPRLLDAPLASTNTNSNSLQTGQPKKRIDIRKCVAYPLKHIHSTYKHAATKSSPCCQASSTKSATTSVPASSSYFAMVTSPLAIVTSQRLPFRKGVLSQLEPSLE